MFLTVLSLSRYILLPERCQQPMLQSSSSDIAHYTISLVIKCINRIESHVKNVHNKNDPLSFFSTACLSISLLNHFSLKPSSSSTSSIVANDANSSSTACKNSIPQFLLSAHKSHRPLRFKEVFFFMLKIAFKTQNKNFTRSHWHLKPRFFLKHRLVFALLHKNIFPTQSRCLVPSQT